MNHFENRSKTFFALVVVIVMAAAAAAQDPPQAAVPSGGVVEIKMTAKRYQFDPNVMTVKKGQKVRLLITALDHNHGFQLPAYNINQKIFKGQTATIEFTADKAGTFPFKCSVYCGLGHRKMKGKLIVEE